MILKFEILYSMILFGIEVKEVLLDNDIVKYKPNENDINVKRLNDWTYMRAKNSRSISNIDMILLISRYNTAQ